MENTKVTKKQKYEMMVAILNGAPLTDYDTPMLVEFCENELSLLDRKASSASRKTDEKTESTMELIRTILGELPLDSKGLAVSQMVTNPRVLEAQITSQRLTAVLTKMKDNGDVVRTVEKKVPYFKLA